jgi:hypothetical protein
MDTYGGGPEIVRSKPVGLHRCRELSFMENVDLMTAKSTGLAKGVSDDRNFETESECEHG